MAGALSEFGRRPIGYKVGVFAAIGAVLALLYLKAPIPFGYKAAKAKLDDARSENSELLSTSTKLDNDAKEYKKKLAEADDLNRMIEENQKALPTESELPAFFDTLGRKVGEAGIEVRRWDYQRELPIESYFKVPIEIEVTGTYYQIKRFFASLAQRDPVPTVRPDGTTQVENRERIVTIENLQLYDPKIRNRGELTMTAKFIASTFRQDAPAAAAADDKKPVKPKPVPAGAGSAQPPAATPAGAKARAEEAMDKSQQRSDDKLKEGVP
jgi:type IV pilus assembly protein PilO